MSDSEIEFEPEVSEIFTTSQIDVNQVLLEFLRDEVTKHDLLEKERNNLLSAAEWSYSNQEWNAVIDYARHFKGLFCYSKLLERI